MQDWMIDMAVGIVLNLLKDSKAAKKYQRAMLKVFAAIARVYKTQEEFHAAAETELNS